MIAKDFSTQFLEPHGYGIYRYGGPIVRQTPRFCLISPFRLLTDFKFTGIITLAIFLLY